MIGRTIHPLWVGPHPGPPHLARRSAPRPARALPSQDPNETGRSIDDVAFKNMSPAARKVFKEASENIMKLNASRMRALQELKAANEKIKELESKLGQAATQLGTIGAPPAAAEAVSAAEPAFILYSNPRGSEAQPQPPQPAAPTIILLVYETGWETAYIHYQLDSKGWTKLPGAKLQPGEGEHAGKKVMSLEGGRMEFVLTNGEGKFDSPNPYGERSKPTNYVVDSPGTWLLSSGRLSKVA